MKKAVIVGASAVAAADLAGQYVGSILSPLGGLAKYGLATLGAYLGEKVTGGASIGRAVMSGVVATVAADIVGPMIPFNVAIPLGASSTNVGRLAAGALGVWAANKVGVEKAP